MEIRLPVLGGPHDGAMITISVVGDSLVKGKRIRADGVKYDVEWTGSIPRRLVFSKTNNWHVDETS